MNRFIPVLCAAILSGCVANQPKADASREVAIETVLRDIQSALAGVQTRLAQDRLPPLKSVSLSLQTVLSEKGGGKLKLVILTIGGSSEKSRTQQVDLVLTPPKPGNPKNISSITDGLEEAILAAARGVREGGQGPIPLVLTSLKVKINFTVKSSGSAGASIEIVPITLDLSGDLGRTDAQTLEVAFEEKS